MTGEYRYRVLGEIPNEDHQTITGSNLPTKKQVLLCFLSYHRQDDPDMRMDRSDAAACTVAQVKPFYERARIPTVNNSNMKKVILTLFDEMSVLKEDQEVSKQS